MNMDQIRELAKIVSEHHLESIELQSDDMTVKIKMPTSGVAVVSSVNQGIKEETVFQTSPEKPKNQANYITAPMVGVFYAAPSPDKEAYVTVGSKVKKGDVLCIIEAMKLMNEITSEKDGEIANILVADGQVVEFAQPLFEIL